MADPREKKNMANDYPHDYADALKRDVALRTPIGHTPGPWGFTYDGGGDYSIGPADDPQVDRIAHVAETMSGHGDWERRMADARLIAAAPDLLHACEAALNDRMFKDWPEIATLLIAAIKKATEID